MAIRYYVFRQIYKCPHCGKRYDYTAVSTSPFGTGSRGHDFKDYLASPFVRCSGCGHIFVDDRFCEWVSMSESQRSEVFNQYNPYRLLGLILPFGTLGLMFVIIGACVPHFFPVILGSCGLVVAIINLIRMIMRMNFTKNRTYNKLIEESVRRTLNKKYLLQLKEAGFSLYKVSAVESQNNLIGKQLNQLIDELE